MKKKTLHLICNSHLDPVWLWEWEEGLAETLSTFRTAARLCRKYEDFVFCHNESLLYQWIEEYEPELFKDIQELVKRGQWHFIGGWFLQPDCNLPSGESVVRQILKGKKYCIEKFGKEPKTAVNFDSFGHSRGLVQILKKSGYTSYLFCRPDRASLELPWDDFIWVGFDASEIPAHRAGGHYNSNLGKAREKIERWLKDNDSIENGILLWGIGDHGGGPSERDIGEIRELQNTDNGWEIKHSNPESYFTILSENRHTLPKFEDDLNPWAVGCYTSMARVKFKHRQLENSYFGAEKMLATASLQQLIAYPHDELREALEDLLFCQFHDILPGSAIPEVEDYALQRLDHGLEIVNRLRVKAFVAMLSGQLAAKDNEFPIFIFNHHPYVFDTITTFEFQPNEPNFDRDFFMMPELFDDEGNPVDFQLEKESCNIATDQRKRIVFRTSLKPSSMNRYSCYLKKVKAFDIKSDNISIETLETAYPTIKHNKEFAEIKQELYDRLYKDSLAFENDRRRIVINKNTGLIDNYTVDGFNYLEDGSLKFLVMEDYPDPWGMQVRSFRKYAGEFVLMDDYEAAETAGMKADKLPPVRIIEDGKIRTIVEALFKYNRSVICVRYKIPKDGCEFEFEARVSWMEKDKMLKLFIPTRLNDSICKGQTAYGVQQYSETNDELVAQKWVGLFTSDDSKALTVINDRTYGFDRDKGELRLSLLRSPAYAGHPVDKVTPIVMQDRFEPRIDQGEHIFRFWMKAGDADVRMADIEREAYIKNDSPMMLSFCPRGEGKAVRPGIKISNNSVVLSALKIAEDENWLIIRLFESTGMGAETEIEIPQLKLNFRLKLNSYEIKSIAVDVTTNEIFEVDLLERKI